MPSISLQQAADAITTAAGWNAALPDQEGIFHFRLEGDIHMELFSPEGRTGVLRGDLGPLPQEQNDAEELLKRCAQKVVAICKKRKSVLSVADGHLHLTRLVPLNDVTCFPDEARDFLNDFVWWRHQLEAGQGMGINSSPFSFSAMNNWGRW